MGSLSLLQGSSQPRAQTQVSALRVDSLPAEPQGKPKNTGVGSLSLLQRIFPTRESNRGLLHCRQFFTTSSAGKESACNAGDLSSIPGSGRSAGEGIGYPLQYSWASLVAQLVKNLPAMWETWVEKIHWGKDWLSTPVFWPGEFHGLYSPWGCKELYTTE